VGPAALLALGWWLGMLSLAGSRLCSAAVSCAALPALCSNCIDPQPPLLQPTPDPQPQPPTDPLDPPDTHHPLLPTSGIHLKEDDKAAEARRPKKKLTELEKWEAKQLIASGVLDVREYPEFDEEGGAGGWIGGRTTAVGCAAGWCAVCVGMRVCRDAYTSSRCTSSCNVLPVARMLIHVPSPCLLARLPCPDPLPPAPAGVLANADADNEEEFEIDMNEDEPAFLKGCSSRSGIEMSPIKIVKNMEGSMQVGGGWVWGCCRSGTAAEISCTGSGFRWRRSVPACSTWSTE
jgi:hypothetical protein